MLVVAIVGGAIAAYFALGAGKARQVAAINRQVRDGFQETTWDAAHRTKMESLVAELTPLDPAVADEMRGQLHQNYANYLRQHIANSPTLREADIQQIETDIAWLEQRDQPAATTLRQQLHARERTWQPVFNLTAPYDTRGEVFADDATRVDDGRLAPGYTTDPGRPAVQPVLTRVSSVGNVRLKAVFDADWKGASKIGLLLHASNSRGYVFRLRTPDVPRVVAKGARLTSAFGK